jgi:geranylgeranyl pyrophosphate synthase
VAALSPLQCHADSTDVLRRVEAALQEAVTADDEFLTEVASHLLVAGGKRLRPSFVVAAGTVHDPEPDVTHDLVRAGASVELVHLGSLYHDDVMDEAALRHGVEAVNARWGNLKAILAGDFLLARASEIAASLGTEVAELLAATIARLCEGQVRELQRIYDVGRTEEQYLAAISGKTAALYASSCRIGALVAGLPDDEVDRLTRFGTTYGMAFQVVDDVLDVVASDEQLGKPSGKDMVEGVYTLPVIRMLLQEPHGDLAALLGRPLDDAEREKARDLVRSDGAIASCITTARGYCEEAAELLAPFGATPSATGMRHAALNLLRALPD